MIIPIQREESALSTMKSCLKSSKQSHTTPIPVSVNSNSSSPVPPLSNSSLIPTTFDRADDHWKDISALSIFEPRIKRWRRDDIEDFLLPSLGKRSLLKEKFSDLIQPFTTQPFPSFAPLLSMNEHPIKIETFNVESDKYVLTLNVNQFKPEELQVKITDTTISVSAKHEDKRDEHNFSCQEFSRSHTLPHGVKPDDVKCELSSDGVLTISAPKPAPAKALHNKETNIPIQHIAPAIRV